MLVSPLPGIDISLVIKEIEEIRKTYKIRQFLMKPVKRTYTFDENNINKNSNSTFLKVKYAASGKFYLIITNYNFYKNHLYQIQFKEILSLRYLEHKLHV